MSAGQDIIDFWYDQAGPQKWYQQSDAFDAEIRRRFETISIDAAACLKKDGHHPWEEAPLSALALIIALDQFPRNMYRGTKAAFAFDGYALAVTARAVEKGFDLKTDMNKRAFFYLPYMHAENLATQNQCVRLSDMRLEGCDNLLHAKEHQKLIAKFGRFPHRNTVLGRDNTPEETLYLKGSGYAP